MAEHQRPPWWMHLVLVPCTFYVLLSWGVLALGPEPVGFGWLPDGTVRTVQPGMAGDRAGVRVGDTIVSVNGETGRLGQTGRVRWRELALGQVGQRLDVVLRRAGQERTVSFTLGRKGVEFWTSRHGLILLSEVPIWALCLGLAWLVAFRRSDQATARLGALVLACWPIFVGLTLQGRPPGLLGVIARLPFPLRALPILAEVIAPSILLVGATMFLASFPRTLVRGRWIWAAPWLFGAVLAWLNVGRVYNLMYSPAVALGPPAWVQAVVFLLLCAMFSSWPVLLVWNYRGLADPGDRRRARVLVVGLGCSLLAILVDLSLIVIISESRALRPWQQWLLNTYWQSPIGPTVFLLQFAAPMAMGYAILRQRVFDVGVILRQGLQYAVARRFVLALAPLFIVALVADLALHSDQTLAQVFLARGWWYAVLAAAAFLAHVKSRAWLPALDRVFFRERYDAQRILRGVLADVRETTDLGAAASRAVSQIDAALHPEFAAILVRRPDEASFRVSVASVPLSAPPEIRSDGRLMALVRVLGKPMELSQSDTGWLRRQLPSGEADGLARARVEWIFPIALGVDRAEGLLVLAPKRSEEPYTQEDQDLVDAIASGLAVVTERTAAVSSRAVPASGGGPFATAETAAFAFGRRYAVRRELGRGGMGSVYEAHDSELERDVAIKVIRPDLLNSAEAAARFKREARAAAGFSHPNVVTVYDFSVAEDGRAYLVMELLTGCSLRDALRREGRFPLARAHAVLRGVSAAVEAAHERRILHRDLKPENVFLVSAGDTETPKVLDFGVAKALDAGERSASQIDTATGQLVGTLAYMSPEQLQGATAEPAWDVWALTVIAYEMLTGAHPFAGKRLPVHAAVLAGRCVPPSEHLGNDGGHWDALFTQALGPEPSQRPATARELLARFDVAAA